MQGRVRQRSKGTAVKQGQGTADLSFLIDSPSDCIEILLDHDEDQAASILFRLSGEVRDEINKHRLTSNKCVLTDATPLLSELPSCRRILHDVLAELLYTENRFRFISFTRAHCFFRSQSPC